MFVQLRNLSVETYSLKLDVVDYIILNPIPHFEDLCRFEVSQNLFLGLMSDGLLAGAVMDPLVGAGARV